MNNFIHLGCWNNVNTKTKEGKIKSLGCVNKVMEKLNSYIKENEVSFISIAGDNYYPEKKKIDEKKKKIIIPELLFHGFNLLPKSLPIYIILGNHDLETNLKIDNPKLFINSLDNPEPEKSCSILTNERTIVSQIPNLSYNFFKSEMMGSNTLILMIDSDVYSMDALNYLPCYNIFLRGNYTSIEEIQRYQYELIFQSINQYNATGNVKNLIIIGHQPITGIKYKNGVKQPPLNDIPYFKPILLEIYKLLGDITYFYLCADLHLYQKGIVKLKEEDKVMTIQQYIVGTGGTELDDEIPNIKFKITGENMDYEMEECKAICGFLHCKLNGEIMSFEFIPIIEQIGGKKKTKKRKRNKKIKTRKYK